MNTAKFKILPIAILSSLFAFTSCKDDVNNSGPNQSSEVAFYLTDAPGDYEEVNVEIIGVEVITDSAKVEVPMNGGVYNLLDFTNGVDTLLGEVTLFASNINQIRLILGDDNHVIVDGETHALVTPSAQQSGLKVNVDQNLVGGLAYNLVIDFDAAKSIVLTGSGKYILKPVLRVKVRGPESAIKGVVQDSTSLENVEPVYAIDAAQDTFSTFSSISGAFTIGGLSSGTYDVVVGTAPDSAHVNSVVVLENTTTDIGTVVIQ